MWSIGTLNALEGGWLLVTVWTFRVTFLNWGWSWRDYSDWLGSKSEDKAVGVQLASDVLIDTILAGVQLLLGTLGVFAALLPDRPDVEYRDLAAINAVVAPLILCVLELGLLAVSWVRYQTRQLQRRWDRKRDRRAADRGAGDQPAAVPVD